MVKIIKDNKEKVVTNGAYETYYKDRGYEIIDDKKSKVEPKEAEYQEIKTNTSSNQDKVNEIKESKIKDSKNDLQNQR